jgi:beta-galactosidase/beta-glucuronidase
LHLGPGIKPETPEVTGQVLDAKNQPVGAAFSAKPTEPAQGTTGESIRLSSHFDGVKLWTAETPNLYQVRFTLLQNGVPQHTITNRLVFAPSSCARTTDFT